MTSLIQYSLNHSRTILLILSLILISGSITFINIPKESNPDVPIAIFYVSISHDGISPEDAERLLIRPMERQLKSLDGLKKLSATASEGHASLTLEFLAGLDISEVMADVRDAVTLAKAKLPSDTEEPTIKQITMAEQNPALTVNLYGEIPNHTLYFIARELRDRLEAFAEVMEVRVNGDREDVLEVLIEPGLLEAYDVSIDELYNFVTNNNRLVAAGTMDSGAGKFAVKVPGVIKTLEDVTSFPLKVNGDRVVTFGDVARLRQTFKDPTSYARLNGESSVSLEIIKQPGKNTIETVNKVRALVLEELKTIPGGLKVAFTGDASKDIKSMLSDLTNNVLSAVLLVAIIILAFLGIRSALLVGMAIPGSFLAGILALSLFGITINVVVLFALIMAVGMLVDGAIVVTEFADRRMSEGVRKQQAYSEAAKRMAWPIIASTATTLAAFMPLLFWPDMMGEFMKYLPMTLVAVLSASLLMALIFVPTLGGVFGHPRYVSASEKHNMLQAETGDLDKITGLSSVYLRVLDSALKHPGKVMATAVAVLIFSYVSFASFGPGVQFFPEVEPPFTMIKVKAIGDLSLNEKDKLVRVIEEKCLTLPDVETVFVKTAADRGSDTIGSIRLNLKDWDERRPEQEIIQELREKFSKIDGIKVEFVKFKAGPAQGKPLQLEILSKVPDKLDIEAEKIIDILDKNPAFTDVSSSKALPGIEWRLQVDREKAAQFGADISKVGLIVPLVTTGIKVADYRPDKADEEVDIRVRFDREHRHLDQLRQLRVKTPNGVVPMSSFVDIEPAQKVDVVQRIDGKRLIKVDADLAPGVLLDNEIPLLIEAFKKADIDPMVEVRLRGENEEQNKSQAFLSKAFLVALFVMAIILVTQFNSFYQAFLILSAVIFSTAGVFLNLFIMQQPFGVVMSGIGIISLAGIIVNNNIVLIDTFNVLRKEGYPLLDAIKRTGVQRLRPVLLTTITTVVGLLPMVMQVNIDILSREISYGAPSTQWWTQLASAVAGGLTFATFLTLIVTPTMLLIGDKLHRRRIPVTDAKNKLAA